MNKELIEHLLKFDVLDNAEKITKASYKTDDLTQRLAALNWIKRGQKLAKELKANSDTFRSMEFLDFINVVMSEGFVPIYNESFQGSNFGDKKVTEALLVFWHEAKGIVLVAESFGGTMVNKAHMYYNWVPNQTDKEWYRATSTGGFVSKGVIWAGHHEVNEAMRYTLDLMHLKGFFVKQWAEQPHLWLVNYTEAKTVTDFEMINRRKMNQFPESVRKAILA